MANKRLFKKNVDLLCADMIEQMMIAYVNVDGADRNSISDAIGKVLHAQETARDNCNVAFDRSRKAFGSEKEYRVEKHNFTKALYAKILKDFDSEISEALKLFNAAIPEAVKKARIG